MGGSIDGKAFAAKRDLSISQLSSHLVSVCVDDYHIHSHAQCRFRIGIPGGTAARRKGMALRHDCTRACRRLRPFHACMVEDYEDISGRVGHQKVPLHIEGKSSGDVAPANLPYLTT